MTHQVYMLLSSLASMPGVAERQPASPEPSSQQECVVLILWLRVAVSVVAPLLYEALADARLWRQHERQRRRAGLPPKGGMQAALYRAVCRVSSCYDSPLTAAIICWLLLAVSWEWCATIAAPSAWA